jgi:AcrR family transcriptional regulator
MTTSPLRADAARNRQRLVAAAGVVLATRGLDAPLDDIAREAGVGNATLYRHFPSRCALIAAVFADRLREVVASMETFLNDDDPWRGFSSHLIHLCELQARDRALADLLTTRVSGAPELEELRRQVLAGLVELIRRAQVAGVLRKDFKHHDVVLILMANAGLLERTADHAPDAWRRQLDFILDGLRQVDGRAGRGAPLADVLEAMQAMAQRYGCGD